MINFFTVLTSIWVIIATGNIFGQCPIFVDAGPDKFVCELGETVTLEGNIGGPYTNFYWEPSSGLSSTTTLNPTATVSGSQTYTLVGEAISTVNSVINGDFEAGATDFSSSYSEWDFSFPSEGTYLVTNNPVAFIGPLGACVDHTSGSGNMMIVDGATTPGWNVWCQDIPVNPNTDYIFSAWFITHGISPPNIQISFNGSIQASFVMPVTFCNWYQETFVWNSGGNSFLTICISDTNTSAFGNDFAIDDISLLEVCKVTDDVEVSLFDIIAQIQTPGILDCNNPEIILDGSGSSFGPEIEYQWTTSNGVILGSDDAISVLIGGSGTYTLTLYGPDGCEAETSITVTGDFDEPEGDAQGATFECGQDVVELSASSTDPGAMFIWNGPQGFSSTESNPIVSETGTYSVQIIGSNGCFIEIFVDVDGNGELPEAEATGGNLDCQSPTVTLSGSSSGTGNTYTWEGPDGFESSSQNPMVSDTGMYVFTVINAFGCEQSDTVFVTGNNLPPDLSTSSQNLDCKQDSALLVAVSNSDSVEYSWIGPTGFISTDSMIAVFDSGWYVVTLTALNGCNVSDSLYVSADLEIPQLEFSADTINCLVNLATLVPNTIIGENQLQWAGPGGFSSTDSTFMVDLPGWYFYQATGSNGCVSSDSIQVIGDTEIPIISGMIDTLTCLRPEVMLDLQTNGQYDFQWEGPNGFSNQLQNPIVTQGGIYSVTVTADNGCTTTMDIEISEDLDYPNISLETDTLDCQTNVVTLQATSNSFENTFIWSGPSGFSANIQNPDVTEPGWYFVNVSGENGCTVVDSIMVFQDGAVPQVSISGGSISCNQPLILLSGNTNELGATFSWSGPNGFNSSDQDVNVNEPGQYSLTIVSTNGCEASAIFMVDADLTGPNIFVDEAIIACDTNFVQLVAEVDEGSLVLNWSGPGGFTANGMSVWTDNPGLYSVEAIDSAGCISIFNTNVNVDTSLPVVILTADTISCDFPIAILNAMSLDDGISWLWTGPDGSTFQNQDINVAIPGVYILEATDTAGCIVNQSIEVIADTIAPTVLLTADTIGCTNAFSSVTFNGNLNGIDLNWSGPLGFNGILASFTTSQPGWYNVIASNNVNGCSTLDSIEVVADSIPPIEAEVLIEQPDCTIPTGMIEIVTQSSGQFQYSLNGGAPQSDPVFEDLPAGIFNVLIENENGCRHESIVEISEIIPVDISGPAQILLRPGEQGAAMYTLNIPDSLIFSIQWTPSAGLSCDNCLEPIISVTTTSEFTLAVTTTDGCIATYTLRVLVEDERGGVYLPNVFSPGNKDGVNDHFYIMTGGDVVNINSFQIYSRWGALLFKALNIPPDDPDFGWDGTVKEKPLNSGVYTYWAEIEFNNGETKIVKGDVTLIE